MTEPSEEEKSTALQKLFKILIFFKILMKKQVTYKNLRFKELVPTAPIKDETETYCLACRKYTKRINPKIVRNRPNRSMIQSNCAVCDSKKSRFIKEHQAMGLLSNLGIKTPLSKVPLLNVSF